MDCPRCGSMVVIKHGFRILKGGRKNQLYLCKNCGRHFAQTTSKRAAILILVPRSILPNVFFSLKTFLMSNPDIRLRKGSVTIKEISV